MNITKAGQDSHIDSYPEASAAAAEGYDSDYRLQVLHEIYDHSYIDEALYGYLDRREGWTDQQVESQLKRFAVATTTLALVGGEVDVDLVRSAFDRLTLGMNETASRRYGYELPRSMTHAILIRFGKADPEPRRYVRPLDDRYWSHQFMDQYANGGLPMVPRQADETGEGYLARYTYTAMHGLLWAPFTYLRG